MPPSTFAELHLDEGFFHPGQRIALAVSGGADSVALLRVLLERRGALGLVLSVAHIPLSLFGVSFEAATRPTAIRRSWRPSRMTMDCRPTSSESTRRHARRSSMRRSKRPQGISATAF